MSPLSHSSPAWKYTTELVGVEATHPRVSPGLKTTLHPTGYGAFDGHVAMMQSPTRKSGTDTEPGGPPSALDPPSGLGPAPPSDTPEPPHA
jgi:hypothetical protein